MDELLLVLTGRRRGAQQIATEQNRREASAVLSVGQEFLSGEQFEKAAEQFSKAVQRTGS